MFIPQSSRKKDRPAGISEKLIRLLKIYTIIANKEFPSAKFLAETLEVNERTIYRDLNIINLVDQVDFDHEKKGYMFAHGDRIKKLLISDEELMTLFTAGEAVSHLGKPFHENFKSLMLRMFTAAGKASQKAKPSIIIKVPDTIKGAVVDPALKVIATCMQDRRSVEITYKAQNTKKVTQRIVDPYGLVFHEGVWLLIGLCHLRKEIRTFALDRIITCNERNLYFEQRNDFNLERYIAKSWGVIDGKSTNVAVRFSRDVAEYITRKERWHPSEERKMLPDGGVELSFTVAGTDEIKKWIYSWIPNVEVTKPRSFRKEIHRELAEATKDHQ